MKYISENVRRFLASSISSVPHVEALLLLSGPEAAKRDWECAAVASRLYQSERSTDAILCELAEIGLIVRGDGDPPAYRFAPRTAELESVVRELAAAYNAHLVEVTQLIHSKRDVNAVRFADAFRWGKK